jgi:Zn-dependent protease
MLKWSFKVGSLFRIPIKIHITFLILLAFVALMGENVYRSLFGVLFVILIFICVIFHELAHSLVARYYGHGVKSITLLPIGGMAQMDDIPEDSKEEILISLAGPLMSVVIAGLLLILVYLLKIPIVPLDNTTLFEGNILLNLFWINIILAVFNIIPAFPMDGGRVLRGVLNLFMSHLKATRIAVFIGQFFAVLLFFFGVFYDKNLWMALIAIFIYLGAEAEDRMWAIRHALSDVLVKEVVLKNYLWLNTGDTLKTASELFLHTLQGDFPVLFGDRLVGILRRESIIRGINEGRESERVADLMERDYLMTTEKQKLIGLYRIMTEKGISMMPVMDGEKLLGIITLEQIGRYHMISAAKGTD